MYDKISTFLELRNSRFVIVEAEKQNCMSEDQTKKIDQLKSLLPGLQFGEYRKLLESTNWDVMSSLNQYTEKFIAK